MRPAELLRRIDVPLTRYLLVGGSSFAVDLGVLTLCFALLNWPLWVATTVGFWTSVAYNFVLQRSFSFRHRGSVVGGLWRCLTVLGADTVATALVVEAFQRAGAGYVIGKTVSTLLITCWNFILYRRWVFARVGDDEGLEAGDLDVP
ncbi:MAG TPA: GtrA family protein [Motilibacteraceae bacterium]|nr:GtrA family protein [Motilibacteraceae bacterium]